jgi:hypothetical protein
MVGRLADMRLEADFLEARSANLFFFRGPQFLATGSRVSRFPFMKRVEVSSRQGFSCQMAQLTGSTPHRKPEL